MHGDTLTARPVRARGNLAIGAVHSQGHRTYPRSRVRQRLRKSILQLLPVLACFLAACGDKPAYDTSTPEAMLASLQQAIQEGHPEIIPQLIDLPARDITFADGVTEASAIGEVKGKAGDMLAQLWRITEKLRARYPDEFGDEAQGAFDKVDEMLPLAAYGKYTAKFLADPFGFISEQREKLTAEDMGDGTAALLYEDEPIFEGAVTLVETDDGWKFAVPLDTMRGSEYFPDTREEWSILASLLLTMENAMIDFEDELDAGKFKTMRAASERVGQTVGASVIVQSLVYAAMKRDDSPPATP